ncbi:MAG TPA: glycosyltransferase family 4 protein [Terracidiphilus sp.]|nr:glycosyltransferase family 4 protein [Terracidiphilus sp.]
MSESTSVKMPHILYITYHLPTDEEPGAFRPWVEARLLQESGYQVTVITSAVQYMTGKMIGSGRGWCQEEMREGIRILRVWTVSDHRRSLFRRFLNYSIFAFLAAVASLRKVPARASYLFAATDPIFLMPFLLLISILKRIPMVLDERDLFPETAIAIGVAKESWITRLFYLMQQFMRRRAVSILAATPGIKRRLVSYGHNPQKIHMLYNGDPYLNVPDGSPLPEQAAQFRKRFRCVACYAGGFGHVNDVGTIIRAAAELKHRDDLGFLILGGGERSKEYNDLARELGVANLIFLGALPRHTARAVLAACDIGLQALPPNPFFGGTLTSKTFEYFGAGRPLVFAGQGDTTDLLKESGAGIGVPAENAQEMATAIARLADDDHLRESMAAAARKWYERNITPGNFLRIMQAAMPLPGSAAGMASPEPQIVH